MSEKKLLPENCLQVGAAKIRRNVLGINTRLFTKLVRVIVHLGSPSKIIYYGPYKLPTKFQTFIRSVTISSNIEDKPHTHTHTHTLIWKHTPTHAHIHTHTHPHTHMHGNIHMQT